MRTRAWIFVVFGGLLLGGASAGATDVTVVTVGRLKLAATGELATPRPSSSNRTVPARFYFGAKFKNQESALLPNLTRIELELSPRVEIDPTGLPPCNAGRLEGKSSAEARTACGAALVGFGNVVWRADFPGNADFSASEELLAFGGRHRGRPAILVHGYDYGAPHSRSIGYVIPLVLKRTPKSSGQTLVGAVPAEVNDVVGPGGTLDGAISSFDLVLSRHYRAGERHSYMIASCPVPGGKPFILGRLTLGLENGIEAAAALRGSCGPAVLPYEWIPRRVALSAAGASS